MIHDLTNPLLDLLVVVDTVACTFGLLIFRRVSKIVTHTGDAIHQAVEQGIDQAKSDIRAANAEIVANLLAAVGPLVAQLPQKVSDALHHRLANGTPR